MENGPPYIAVAGKHGNPCGAAIDWENPARAIKKALFGDPLAVMGGEVVVNFPITNEMSSEEWDTLMIAWAACWCASSNTVALAKDLALIGLGCGQQDRVSCVRLAIDRANRAQHNTKGAFFASDAFFPYAVCPDYNKEETSLSNIFGYINDIIIDTRGDGIDPDPSEILKKLDLLKRSINFFDRREGPQLLADAGCKGGIVPADGKNLEEVKIFFRQANMAVAFLSPENRGFAKHA